MLPKFHSLTDAGLLPRIEKRVGQEDASHLGAFSFGTRIALTVHVPRALGSRAVVLRIFPDDVPVGHAADVVTDTNAPGLADTVSPGGYLGLPRHFTDSAGGTDVYTLTLDTAALCGRHGYGLFYYELLFLRGLDTLFTSSVNNVDFTLESSEGSRFRLLVHEADLRTPAWFCGGTMYHIFVDRFCRGAGPVALREGAELDENWESGIPQYNAYPGAPLANNRFFGGNLWGIIEKLDMLQSLGVTVLYLSPIFEAASNHKYDTGDYETVDALFGGEAAFDRLIEQTKKRGMRVILDGVFNHTGDDSRYFNRYGRYDSVGAYQSPASPYADWYSFREFPDTYECWWDIPILPRLNSHLPACRTYLAGRNGIAATRVRRGISGWRLDVVDELSDEFLDELRESIHQADSEQPLLIGEVWENAADKIAYGKRRRYFSGRQLDSVMNYPLRNGIIAMVRDGDAHRLYDTLTELYSSYPATISHCLMNFLGTHDTERIITVLGDPFVGDGRTNAELAIARLTPEQYEIAAERVKMAMTLLFTVFGVPSVFYGDEAGLQGHHDPFCRMPYPWGREDTQLLQTVRALATLRHEHACLADGDFRIVAHTPTAIAYERRRDDDRLLIVANADDTPLSLALSQSEHWHHLPLPGQPTMQCAMLPPHTAAIFRYDPTPNSHRSKETDQ